MRVMSTSVLRNNSDSNTNPGVEDKEKHWNRTKIFPVLWRMTFPSWSIAPVSVYLWGNAGPAGGNQGNAGVECKLQKCGVGFSPPVCGALGVIGLSGRACCQK